ncbi:hypothetical protein [Trueperella sp. LYQ141]|uniref:hypothetical protein n=1 Tax=Trueperella sp. LYQ141 TaxID=3391058 RepID=UPI003982E073
MSLNTRIYRIPHTPGAEPHPDDGKASHGYITSIIEHAIANQPRSLQTMIGPSEIGMECDHCLAARLAGWTKHGHDTPWLPFIGTAVHEKLERIFNAYNHANPPQEDGVDTPEFFTEQKVTVGKIGGQPITGSTDLYRTHMRGPGTCGMTVDWKIVGDTTLRKVKATGQPSMRYQVQAHLYARGWNMAGYPTSHVAVYFMPRNRMTLNDGYWWTVEYDEQIAHAALERANSIYTSLTMIEKHAGTAARDTWITSLPRDANCYDCPRYPDYPTNLNTLLTP